MSGIKTTIYLFTNRLRSTRDKLSKHTILVAFASLLRNSNQFNGTAEDKIVKLIEETQKYFFNIPLILQLKKVTDFTPCCENRVFCRFQRFEVQGTFTDYFRYDIMYVCMYVIET